MFLNIVQMPVEEWVYLGCHLSKSIYSIVWGRPDRVQRKFTFQVTWPL